MQAISDSNQTGVSWGAIFAGAACAAALAFILLILGFGLGLSAVSPWSNTGASAAVIGVSSILWVTFSQVAASGLGGYLAGRLRVRWVSVHNDEVYFRDTAHGLITWSVATLFAAALLASTVSSILSGGARVGAEVAGGAADLAGPVAEAAVGGDDADADYFVDALLRTSPDDNAEQRAGGEVRDELATLLFRNLMEGELSTEDFRYAAQVVAHHTNLSQQQAQERVTSIVERARQARQEALEAADEARENAAYSALWIFVALLGGAFFSSYMATVGGRQRDSG